MRFPKTKKHPYVKAFEKDVDPLFGLLSLLAIVRLLPFGDRLRNILPEPFDLVDHIGNLVLSFCIGYVLTLLIAKILYSQKINPRRALMAARGITLLIVVVLNVLFETPAGIKAVGSSSTPDYIDLGHGVVGGVLGVLWIQVGSTSSNKKQSPKI